MPYEILAFLCAILVVICIMMAFIIACADRHITRLKQDIGNSSRSERLLEANARSMRIAIQEALDALNRAPHPYSERKDA